MGRQTLRLGNVYGDQYGESFAGNVWDTKHMCPTLKCESDGGGRVPMICTKQVYVIGQMDGTVDHTFESANRVYGAHGCSPTIPTCAGGNIQPKVLVKQIKVIGRMDHTLDHTFESANRVYDPDGISPTIPAVIADHCPKILEKK